MFESVLIANRGEIACRIIKTAERLGMRTIAVYSDADAGARHVTLADEAHRIGPPPARESYLDIARLIEVAREAGAACVHPGYGFLAENAEFAKSCAEVGIVFVGPPPAAIRAMGLKDEAKFIMERAGVPVVPGYHGADQDPGTLRERAHAIGYPVLIKAVAGGGGKGMRRVDKARDFEAALEGAQREALSAFGDPRVLVEKYVANPRHIEIQVFADGHGNAVHLFERDCSLQRRHQKVVEEAPAPGMPAEMRAAMGEAAVEAARAVGYRGAGTVEFIADASKGLRPDAFWFMEMNTRLQVEHPVTEAVTGLDLVELQFRVAAGEPLPFAQSDLAIRGHAVEVRLYAEDPERGFLPSTGPLRALAFPDTDHVRIDTGVSEGDVVSPFYDPMIAKLIAWGETRDAALDRLTRALEDTVVAGPRTNLAFLIRLLAAEPFRAGRFDTGFIDAHLAELLAAPQVRNAAALGLLRLLEREHARLAAEARMLSNEPASPWSAEDGFQLGPERRLQLPVLVDGEPASIEVGWGPDGVAVHFVGEPHEGSLTLVDAPEGVYVLDRGRQTYIRWPEPEAADFETEATGQVRAPLHGRVIAVSVSAGQAVEKGDKLAVIEAMKMEHSLLAPRAGRVAEVAAKPGDQVEEGQPVVILSED